MRFVSYHGTVHISCKQILCFESNIALIINSINKKTNTTNIFSTDYAIIIFIMDSYLNLQCVFLKVYCLNNNYSVPNIMKYVLIINNSKL